MGINISLGNNDEGDTKKGPVVAETKPFYRTSEFWLVIAVLAGTMTDVIPTDYEGLVAALVAAAYALSRGFAKQGVPYDEELTPEELYREPLGPVPSEEEQPTESLRGGKAA